MVNALRDSLSDVALLDHPITQVKEELRLARSMRSMSQSGLREVMDLVNRPGVLSLAVGLPAAEMFPTEAIADATARLLTSDPVSLQYGVPSKSLKAQIVELMALRGVRCRAEQVFLTSGAQQALDLMACLLLDPHGEVMIERTVYDGIQMAVKRFEPEILTVSTDPETGIEVDEIEALLLAGHRPAFIYVITDGHNPLGVSVSQEKRYRLVELAREFGVPIIEDDAYGLLYYEQAPAAPLRALDDEWVLYVGSFSKILAPALRAGWAVVPEHLVPRLSALKHAADIDTPSFSHRAISVYLESGHHYGHLVALRNEYRRRRNALLGALEAYLPPYVKWNYPTSGMFVWVELPRNLDATTLLRTAVERESVAFSPGAIFCGADDSHARHCLRLTFASCTPEKIEEGIRRLARAIEAAMR